MPLLDLLWQEYLKGRVIEKYMLRNGNIGLIIEEEGGLTPLNESRFYVSILESGKRKEVRIIKT